MASAPFRKFCGFWASWARGNTVHGHSRALRSWLEDAGLHHVLAVSRNEKLWTGRDLWRMDEVQAAYAAFAPRGCDPGTLVAVAGRWCIERAFEVAKQETGLDDYEVRSAHSWYRPATLTLWALALRAAELDRPHPQKKSPGMPGLAAFKRARGLAVS